MAHVVNQPTLSASWQELDIFVRSLGPFLACTWCALERSRTESRPVAAGGLATQAIETLSSLRVLRQVPLPLSTGAARSLYEPVAWSYHPPWSRPEIDLAWKLTTVLHQWSGDCPAISKQRLWLTLGENEASGYLANLLRKHQMDPGLGRLLRSTHAGDWERLSVGRKRYVLWSSMRGAASELLGTGMSEECAAAVLDREIGAKSRWLARRELAGSLSATDYCFLPGAKWRQPLLLDVALTTFLPVGRAYWLEPAYRWKF